MTTYPAELYGIRSSPPLQYCPTHRRWESWRDREDGCEWCCQTQPCPLGHAEDYWPSEEMEREWLIEQGLMDEEERDVKPYRKSQARLDAEARARRAGELLDDDDTFEYLVLE